MSVLLHSARFSGEARYGSFFGAISSLFHRFFRTLYDPFYSHFAVKRSYILSNNIFRHWTISCFYALFFFSCLAREDQKILYREKMILTFSFFRVRIDSEGFFGKNRRKKARIMRQSLKKQRFSDPSEKFSDDFRVDLPHGVLSYFKGFRNVAHAFRNIAHASRRRKFSRFAKDPPAGIVKFFSRSSYG